MGMTERSALLRRTGRWVAVAATAFLVAGSAAQASPRPAADPAPTAGGAAAPTAPRYDDLPAARAFETAFVLDRGRWPSRLNITYRFANTTADVGGFEQRQAIRFAIGFWQNTRRVFFSEVTTGGDIVFSFGSGDHGDGFPFDGTDRILAHGFYPPPTNANPLAGDVHFDDAETWTTATRTGNTQPIDLQTVAAHEIGHALGLRHSADSTSLMFDKYTGSHRFLSTDDVDGITAAYP